jgi:hypothetical protein
LLTDIPYLPDDELEQGLKQAVGHFGTILDIGLNQESTDGWFMGSDYAVIQQDEVKTYPELHHTIPWVIVVNFAMQPSLTCLLRVGIAMKKATLSLDVKKNRQVSCLMHVISMVISKLTVRKRSMVLRK